MLGWFRMAPQPRTQGRWCVSARSGQPPRPLPCLPRPHVLVHPQSWRAGQTLGAMASVHHGAQRHHALYGQIERKVLILQAAIATADRGGAEEGKGDTCPTHPIREHIQRSGGDPRNRRIFSSKPGTRSQAFVSIALSPRYGCPNTLKCLRFPARAFPMWLR